MTHKADKHLFFVSLLFGVYAVIQGLALVMSENPLGQMLGMGVWLWVPGCAYYTWRGYRGWMPKPEVLPLRVKPVAEVPAYSGTADLGPLSPGLVVKSTAAHRHPGLEMALAIPSRPGRHHEREDGGKRGRNRICDPQLSRQQVNALN
jgi:hypothetical protein